MTTDLKLEEFLPYRLAVLSNTVSTTVARAYDKRFSVSIPEWRVIAILGMHRAGTSSLAGSLEAAGLFLGDVHGRGQWNQKGNRESRFLMKLHEDVLKANGGNWHRPPASVTWLPEHEARRDRYIRQRLGRPAWGFKDPRTTFTLVGSPGSPLAVEIFDPRGRRVRTLAGVDSAVWDGRDERGRELPAGVYLARVKTPRGEAVSRVVAGAPPAPGVPLSDSRFSNP